MIQLDLSWRVRTAGAASERVFQTAAMFGLGVDESHEAQIIPPLSLSLRPGRLIFITGASGGGKSALLRLIAARLRQDADPPHQARVIEFDTAPPPGDAPLIDQLGSTLQQATELLSLAGLGDAFVMLRRPGELSDGQRHRFALARTMEAATMTATDAVMKTEAAAHEGGGPAAARGESPLPVILADEFGSTLDRAAAHAVARNLRKWVTRSGVCFIAATAHDDLLEPLQPDVLVVQHPGQAAQVLTRPP